MGEREKWRDREREERREKREKGEIGCCLFRSTKGDGEGRKKGRVGGAYLSKEQGFDREGQQHFNIQNAIFSACFSISSESFFQIDS